MFFRKSNGVVGNLLFISVFIIKVVFSVIIVNRVLFYNMGECLICLQNLGQLNARWNVEKIP